LRLGNTKNCFGDKVTAAVIALAKEVSEDYLNDYLPRLIRDEVAKWHDLADNLNTNRLPA